MDTNNKTLYGLQRKGWQIFWLNIYVITIFSSIVGNSIILVASIKFKAIKLDKVTGTLIQHIAISDLGHTLTTILPRVVGLLAEQWVLDLGRVAGDIRVFTGYYFWQSSMFLVMALNCSKLLCLVYPFRARTWTIRLGHAIAGAVWTLSALWPLLFILVDPQDVYFDYRVYATNYGFTSSVWVYLLPVVAGTLGILPNMVVMATTVILLVLAHQIRRHHQSKLQRQGTLTAILIAVVYCISNIPLSVYFIGQSCGVAETDSAGQEVGMWYIHFYRFTWNIVPLNNLANIFIYTYSIKSFREFVRNDMWRCGRGEGRVGRRNYRNVNSPLSGRTCEISCDL